MQEHQYLPSKQPVMHVHAFLILKQFLPYDHFLRQYDCIYVQCPISILEARRIGNIDLVNNQNNLARTLINRLLKFNEQTHHSSSHSTSRIYIASRHGYLTSCSSENIIVEEIGLFTVFLYSDVGLHFLLLMLEVYVKILEDLKVKNICYVTCDTDRTLIERVPFFS